MRRMVLHLHPERSRTDDLRPRMPSPRYIMSVSPLQSWRLRVFVAIWIAGLLAGFGWVMAFEATPGEMLPAPRRWSAETPFALDREKPTIILYLHPRCVCSQASLELAKTFPTQAVCHVVFYQPTNAAEEWTDSPLVRAARNLVGATVHVDTDGVLARRLGIANSGHALLFTPEGALRFSGGITAGRGVSEPGNSWRALGERLKDPGKTEVQSPVFGCPIYTSPSPSETCPSCPP